jgi:hypothetical protein
LKEGLGTAAAAEVNKATTARELCLAAAVAAAAIPQPWAERQILAEMAAALELPLLLAHSLAAAAVAARPHPALAGQGA